MPAGLLPGCSIAITPPRAAGGGSQPSPGENGCCWQKVDEQVDYGGQRLRVYPCDRWADGAIQPEGYRFIEQFRLEGTVPVWTFACGDALLEKRIWMAQGENTTYLQYRVVRASQPLSLSLKAFFNYRDHHGNTQASDWQMQIRSPPPNGVEVRAFGGGRSGLCGWLTPAQVSLAHTWYRGYTLATEQYRGIFPHDDHLHGATFEVEFSVGQSFTLVASTSANSHLDGHCCPDPAACPRAKTCWIAGTGERAIMLPCPMGRSTRTGGGSICGGSGR